MFGYVLHLKKISVNALNEIRIFSVCAPPSSVGAYYLHPQTHVPFFYKKIYYVMTSYAVTGSTNGRDPKIHDFLNCRKRCVLSLFVIPAARFIFSSIVTQKVVRLN